MICFAETFLHNQSVNLVEVFDEENETFGVFFCSDAFLMQI